MYLVYLTSSPTFVLVPSRWGKRIRHCLEPMQISESKQTIAVRAGCFISGLIATLASAVGFLWVVVVLSRHITRWEFTYLSMWPLGSLGIAVLMFRRALQNR
jgi:hypothetical protein